jgi:ADP-ribose pyrophosphatase
VVPYERSIVYRGRSLDVIWDDGTEYTHNRRSRGVVLVVPVTASGDIILLAQYRPALRCVVIEFPAGLVGDDDPDESAEAAARRELLEESGYAGGTLEFLLRGPASPGSSTEVVDFFLARDVRQVNPGGGVAHERIHVHRLALAEVDAWLVERTKAGLMVDPRVHLGIHLARCRPPG